MARVRKKNPDASILVSLTENTVTLEPQFKDEESMVVILLSLVTGEMYSGILNRLKEMSEQGKITPESFNRLVKILQQSLAILQTTQEEEFAIKPSQVFR